MIHIVKYNAVFDHIERMILDIYQNDNRYDNAVLLLGFNQMAPITQIRHQFPNKKIIIYQLERLYDGSDWTKPKHIQMLREADEIWEYDQSNMKWLWEKHQLKAFFRPLVYTESLKTLPITQSPDIDVLFYGYMHERRARVMYHMQLKASGSISIINAYGVWGDQLNELISRAKIVVNLHGDESLIQEQARIFYPVINNKCIVSEPSTYNYFGNSIIQVPFNKLTDTCISLIRSGQWKDYATNASTRYQQQSQNYLKYWI